jgi:tetratricopeptide (TPR) repeat protein
MHQKIGEMNEILFRFDDALSAYRTALEINPDNAASRLALGGLYLQRDLVDEALAEYNRVASTHLESADAHYGLAEANLRLGRFAESASAAEKALALDPKHQRSRYVRAVALIRAGRSEEGQHALEEYLRANADLQAEERRVRSLASSSGSVVAKLVEGEYEEAIRLLRERIDTEPGAAGLYLELGLTQSRLGRHMEAVRTFQTMIGMGLDGFLVHRNLYLQYEILGNTSASQHHRVIYLQKYDAVLKLKASLN